MEWLSGFGDVKAAGKSSGESRCWRSSAALPGPLPAPQRRQPADGAGGEALRCFVREEMRRGDFSLRLRLFFFVVRLLSLLLCCSASASLRSLRGLRALLLAQAGAGLPRGRAPGRGGARRGAAARPPPAPQPRPTRRRRTPKRGTSSAPGPAAQDPQRHPKARGGRRARTRREGPRARGFRRLETAGTTDWLSSLSLLRPSFQALMCEARPCWAASTRASCSPSPNQPRRRLQRC